MRRIILFLLLFRLVDIIGLVYHDQFPNAVILCDIICRYKSKPIALSFVRQMVLFGENEFESILFWMY